MTKSQTQKIDALIRALPEDECELYRDIAEYAVALGYAPSPVKNVHGLTGAVAFTSAKVGKRLCKISPPNENHGSGKALYGEGKTILALAFYATPVYSALFRNAIEQELATGGCTRCKLVELPPISSAHVDEIKAMMKTQDDFWVGGTHHDMA
ncbi:MAG: hypothetical protein FWD06_02400 [Oscillospiraceae bacterium]|nr:hypothetical protein [Oscillospiraceae bacterium]